MPQRLQPGTGLRYLRSRRPQRGAMPVRAPCAHQRIARAVFAVIAACAFTMDVVPAQTVSSIIIKGTKRIEAEMVRAYFHAGPTGRLDPAAIDAALKAIFASGMFTDVQVSRTAERLIVTVVEAPVINRVQLEGNKSIKDQQILSELQSKPLGGFTKAKAQADVTRIVDLYRAIGRYGVRVEPKTIERSAGRVDLVFEIREGDKTPVRKIVFVGNRSQSERRLKEVIRTRESGLLSLFKSNDVYDADLVSADSNRLRRFYLSHGFADVRIRSAAGKYDEALKGFVVTIVIDEGERYLFGTVNIDSRVPTIDKAALTAIVLPRPGDTYNADAVDKTIDQLTVAMSKSGHPFAAAQARAERNPESKAINVVFTLDEGRRVYIERINIHGNTRTREYVIRREFDIAEGDAYNRALLDRAERRLKNLGYFKSVKITSAPGSTPDRVIVDVDCDDQPTGDFSFAGGYSTADGLIGEVSIADRNLLGTGDQGKISATLGQYTKGFSVMFTEPYAFGTRMSVGGELFAKQSLANSYQSYGSETYGTNIQVGMPLTEELTQQLRYSIYNQSLSLNPAMMDCSPANPPPACYGNGEAALPVKQAVLNGPAWVSMIGSSLIYNTLDNNKSPKNGFRAQFSQDVAGLGGDAKFLRSTDDVRYYHELSDGVVGVLRAQGGFLTPWGGQPVPFQSSFFGGPQLVRGFAANGFGPRDITPGTKNDNVGGTKYWATTAELQSALPFMPADFGMRAAVFADAGSLWGYHGATSMPSLSQPMQVGDSRTVRSSLGAGLIWDSPFGALRVDYAFPTSKAAYDVPQRVRFGAGPF